ncbi:MAG TPA: hypothetical protein VF624_03905 [Tepidisphaeraceae bacterium]|jgi:hypothetical protein
MLRLSPKKQEPEDELELGKARFKIAAIQAAPSDIIRRHPFSSLLGTTAIAVAIGALAAGSRSRRAAPTGHANGQTNTAAPPPVQKANWIGPVLSMASNLVQAYVTKQMTDSHEAATSKMPPADNAPPQV